MYVANITNLGHTMVMIIIQIMIKYSVKAQPVSPIKKWVKFILGCVVVTGFIFQGYLADHPWFPKPALGNALI